MGCATTHAGVPAVGKGTVNPLKATCSGGEATCKGGPPKIFKNDLRACPVNPGLLSTPPHHRNPKNSAPISACPFVTIESVTNNSPHLNA